MTDERLKEILETARSYLDDSNKYFTADTNEIIVIVEAILASQAEVAKLRAVLVQIAHDTSDNDDFYLQHMAQEALASKGGTTP